MPSPPRPSSSSYPSNFVFSLPPSLSLSFSLSLPIYLSLQKPPKMKSNAKKNQQQQQIPVRKSNAKAEESTYKTMKFILSWPTTPWHGACPGVWLYFPTGNTCKQFFG